MRSPVLQRLATPVAVVLGALAIQLGLMWYLGDRAYPDVFIAIENGARLSAGETPLINSKTIVGPVLWHRLYELGGLVLLRATSVVLLVAFLVTAYRLGRERFGPSAAALGLFLVAFYPGTHRNVVAGEQDDMVGALAVALGAWLILTVRGNGERRSVSRAAAVAGLIMGFGVLFKYWVGIFALGLVLVLIMERGWREAVVFAACVAIPFAGLNLFDGFESYRSLAFSFTKQSGYTSWAEVGSKLLTTGLVLFLGGALIGWLRDRDPGRLPFLLIPLPYVVYVLVVRDAWAMTFVMMVMVMFWGMLVARELVERAALRRNASSLLAGLALLYVLGTTAIVQRNLLEDTTTAAGHERGG